MISKYIDTPSIVQVIGCVFKSPQLLDYTDKYTITEDDFQDDFHKIVFGTIYKLHELGAEKITLNSIADYLSSRPKSEAIFIKQKGEEWLLKAEENANTSSFDYYYNRMKKMTLLRAFEKYGIDVKDIYDPDNIIDLKLRQQQEDKLDNTSLEGLAQIIQDKIDDIRATYVDDSWGQAH
jgi:replicative DNA helicase